MQGVQMAGMKRSPLVRKDPDTVRLTIKPKACKVCRTKFLPVRPMQIACGPLCAYAYAGKVAEGKAKAERKEDKAKREALKTIPQLIKEAQFAFNAYIRARDRAAGHACICCGKPLEWGKLGGAADAGHFRSTGSAGHLRFHEDNCHAQRASCNRYGAGRAVDYRIGLVSRIGIERLNALEANNEVTKWTREGLRAIKAEYQAKAAELRKAANE
jgi:hypothetical protein